MRPHARVPSPIVALLSGLALAVAPMGLRAQPLRAAPTITRPAHAAPLGRATAQFVRRWDPMDERGAAIRAGALLGGVIGGLIAVRSPRAVSRQGGPASGFIGLHVAGGAVLGGLVTRWLYDHAP